MKGMLKAELNGSKAQLQSSRGAHRGHGKTQGPRVPDTNEPGQAQGVGA